MDNSPKTDATLEERCYNEAVSRLKLREYKVAYHLFDVLGDYKDAKQKGEEAKQAYDKSCDREDGIFPCCLVVLFLIGCFILSIIRLMLS